MAKTRIAFLVSQQGKNLQGMINTTQSPDYPAEIAIVIVSRPESKAIEIAHAADLPCHVCNPDSYENVDEFEGAIEKLLKAHEVELVCLSAFMHIFSGRFISHWRNRIMTDHPSLLPAFRGLYTFERILRSGVKITGCTIHFVRADLGEGPIIAQGAIPVYSNDTIETLDERLLKLRHKLYPMAVRLYAEKRLRVSGERVVIEHANRQEDDMVIVPAEG